MVVMGLSVGMWWSLERFLVCEGDCFL
jgi:hypothetical protein